LGLPTHLEIYYQLYRLLTPSLLSLH
jgi:hypothetical protein